MAVRVAQGRIVVGSGASRKIITPGTLFKTEDYGLDDKAVKDLDASGAVRRRLDDVRPAMEAEEAEVEEDEDDAAAAEAAAAAPKPKVKPGRKPKASEDLDL